MREPTEASDIPVSAKLPDGHDDARPWQSGFAKQTGQLEKANDRASNVDHIYAECLKLHREQLDKDTGGVFSRIF